MCFAEATLGIEVHELVVAALASEGGGGGDSCVDRFAAGAGQVAGDAADGDGAGGDGGPVPLAFVVNQVEEIEEDRCGGAGAGQGGLAVAGGVADPDADGGGGGGADRPGVTASPS